MISRWLFLFFTDPNYKMTRLVWQILTPDFQPIRLKISKHDKISDATTSSRLLISDTRLLYWLNLWKLDSESYTNISESIDVEKCREVGSAKRSWAGAKSSLISLQKKNLRSVVHVQLQSEIACKHQGQYLSLVGICTACQAPIQTQSFYFN